MADNQSFDLNRIYRLVRQEAWATWRYRWYALVLAWCVAILGALLVFGLPNKYQSTAQVYADTGALMNPLLNGLAVHPDVRARLKVITHTLLSRPNLKTVANTTGLSLRATTPAEGARQLTRLGSAVTIRGAGTKDLYDLSYTDRDPEMAQKVVQGFVQILMNDTLGANSTSMTTAQHFLKQQVHDYGEKLNQEQQKIADFKQAHIGYIQTSGGRDYFSRLAAAQADLETLEGEYAGAGTGHVTTSRVNAAVQAIDKQISAYRQKLDNLLLNYTDKYPGVVSTQRAIAELKARRATASKQGGTLVTHADPGGDTKSALSSRIAQKKQEIAELKSKTGQAATVQTTLQRLERNLTTTQKQYGQLVSRLNTAQLSQDAAQSGNNLKFRVVSPPVVPVAPVSPKRGRMLLVVFVFAVGIGIVFAYFLHRIHPVFANTVGLREFGDYPVIGSVSLIESRAVRHGRRRAVAGFCAATGLLVVAVAAGFAFDGQLVHLVQHVFVVGAV